MNTLFITFISPLFYLSFVGYCILLVQQGLQLANSEVSLSVRCTVAEAIYTQIHPVSQNWFTNQYMCLNSPKID